MTWWAHPFTGLELGTLLFVWSAVETFLAWRHDEPVQPWIRFLGGLGFLNAVFFLYYGLFLGSFEEHRSLVEIWRGPEVTRLATAPFTHLLLSYGPLLLGLLWVASRDGREHLKFSPIHRLLLVWFGVVFVLMHHDKLPGVRHPVQPLHFTRGYLYVVLCLWLGTLFARTNPAVPLRRRWLGVAAGLILAIAVADNALFFHRFFRGGEARQLGMLSIPDSEYSVLTRLGKIPGSRLVFTIESQPTRGVSFLLNTYTPHRSFLGHGANTPFLRDRVAAYRDWIQKPQRGLLDIIGAQAVVAETAFVDRQPWANGKKPIEFLDNLLRGDFERTDAPEGYALWLRKAPQKPSTASGGARPPVNPKPTPKPTAAPGRGAR